MTVPADHVAATVRFEFAQRVTFTSTLHRVSVPNPEQKPGMHLDPRKEWVPRPTFARPAREGIIIGRRVLANGTVSYAYYAEDQTVFTATDHVTCYLIVTDMRSAPVYVLPEHIAAL